MPNGATGTSSEWFPEDKCMAANFQNEMGKKIWYASYGSNLSLERFMCYIAGGTPVGSTNTNSGSRDKTPPSAKQPVSLDLELYFAGYSANWHGAPAFTRRSDKAATTLGRMYLITDDQFNDVVMQENDCTVDGSRFVPRFEELIQKDEFFLPGNRLYGHLLRVDKKDGWPVLTFTTKRDQPINAPSETYIKVIVSGLMETYPDMTNAQICAYLLNKEGVQGRIQPEQIASWVDEGTR